MIIKFNKKAVSLENQGHYYEAGNYLYSLWKKDMRNKNRLLCAGMEQWYLWTFNDRYDTGFEGFSLDLCESKLKEIYLYGADVFGTDPDFLALFGYCIKCQPFWLYDGRSESVFFSDIYAIENLGKEMISKAFLLNSEDPVIVAIFREEPSIEAYNELKQWGNSAIQFYFMRILRIELLGIDLDNLEKH